MAIGLDLGVVKSGSIACWIIAVIFAYDTITYQNNLYLLLVVVFAIAGFLIYKEEVKIRKYEADKLIERSKIENEAKVNAEKEKTNRNNTNLLFRAVSKATDWIGKNL